MASRRINLVARRPGDTCATPSLLRPSGLTLSKRVAQSILRFRTSASLLLSLCALALFFHSSPTHAAAPLSSSDVEAAYLYNFGKFIEWPAPADPSPPPFSICVLGKDEFAATLDSLVHNDTINGRTIVAKHLPSIVASDNCQILFLGTSEQAHLAKDLDIIKDKSILTVSTIPGFLDRGGMIQFLVRDSRVRFAVNLASATRVHLTLSSELLKVAVSVDSRPSREAQ